MTSMEENNHCVFLESYKTHKYPMYIKYKLFLKVEYVG